jgi:putative ABC transport system ATP-binding protein
MQPLIEFQHTGFSIPGDKTIIHDISTAIYPGDFVVVLGGNGSGKSTLLKLLNRTYNHTAGDIAFKEKSITHYDFKTLRHEMVTITQFIGDSIFADLTIEENAILIESSYLKATHQSFQKKKLLAELPGYLSEFNSRLVNSLKTPVKYLSGGEQQILAFALYLRHQPSVLLLDEPTSALDPKKSDYVMAFISEVIRKKHITCLMTTHQLDYALKYGNRLLAIREGNIAYEASESEKATLSMADLLTHCY